MKYSPFYKDFYKNVDYSQIRSVDDIHLLPILDKETLRSNIEKVYTTESVPCSFAMTGGTTGKSLVVKMTIEDSQKRMAYQEYVWLCDDKRSSCTLQRKRHYPIRTEENFLAR